MVTLKRAFNIKIIHHFYKNASMIEINPLLKTYDNNIIAVDTKVVRDDNALYRHTYYAAMRDIDEEETADAHRVEKAVCLLLKDKGIIAANKIIEGGIRFQGTNAKEALRYHSGLCVHYVGTLKEAAAKIKEILI